MPPVLTTSCRNYDYDYDAVQPYFLLDGEEEEFYLPPRHQLLPGPGEDMWKKFELLPTPPLSPSRRLSDAALSAADHLEALSALLDEDRNPSASVLQSFIIQDCMWSSSFAAATKLEQVVSERLASLRARRASTTSTSTCTPDTTADQQVSSYLQDLHTAAGDCIAPSAVLACSAVEAAPGPRLDTPPLSSSDSDSEEEEEDDEEIDVVSVDRRSVSRRSDAPLKRSHVNIHQHNYAAQPPAGKRVKPDGGSSCSPRPDGEDYHRHHDDRDKRRTHNVLERQRRNELKRSFLALRDQVPALAHNHKAAKVVILKQATEFITEVAEHERRLLTTKEQLRKRSRQLKHRLQQLRTL